MTRIWGLAFALLAGACQPVYKTDYAFVQPQSDKGRQCVMRCTTRLDNCRASALQRGEANYQRCEADADGEYEHCQARAGSTAERGRCYRHTCAIAADYGSCDADYRGCFEVCGGSVTVRKVCEQNC